MKPALRPLVTWTLGILCTTVSLAILVWPELYRVLGGNGPVRWPGQWLTPAFAHGFSRASLLPHLAGNLVLLALVGPPVERALGSRRFAALTALALALFVVARALSGVGVNGASVFLWSWAPPAAVTLWWGELSADAASGIRVALVVMWIAVPLAMTAVPYIDGWEGDPVGAFGLANLYHGTATLAGALVALAWRGRLTGRSG